MVNYWAVGVHYNKKDNEKEFIVNGKWLGWLGWLGKKDEYQKILMVFGIIKL